MIEHAGIYRMTLEEYLADPAPQPSLNASTLHVLENFSPYHAWWQHPRLNPAFTRAHAGNFDVGTAFHAMVLEGAEIFVVVDAADWKTKAAKSKRTEIRKAGKVPLLPDQRALLGAMHRALMRALADYRAQPVPLTGEPERTLLWKDGAAWCRCRPDSLSGDGKHAWDLKTTTASAHPGEWGRTLFNTGADLQHAMIRRGVKRLLGVEPDVDFVVVETEPPHGVSIMTLDPEAQEHASMIVRNGLDTWAECLSTGRWPSYTLRTATLELPAWLKMKSGLRSYYHSLTP